MRSLELWERCRPFNGLEVAVGSERIPVEVALIEWWKGPDRELQVVEFSMRISSTKVRKERYAWELCDTVRRLFDAAHEALGGLPGGVTKTAFVYGGATEGDAVPTRPAHRSRRRA